MYHWIVRGRVRALWAEVGAGDYERAVRMAVDDLEFEFAGSTPVSAKFRGRNEFRAWFASLYVLFPGLRLTLTDVVSSGWPWKTTVVVRLNVAATLRDGSAYRNEAVQWTTLRWGRLATDWVLEDTQALSEACRIQSLYSGNKK